MRWTQEKVETISGATNVKRWVTICISALVIKDRVVMGDLIVKSD